MDHKKLINAVMVFGVIAAAAFGIRLFVSRNGVVTDSGERFVMGTIAHMVVVAPDSRTGVEAIEAAFAELNAVNAAMSSYIEGSELSILNRDGFDREVKVSDELFEVISTAVEYSKKTDGAFDITVRPLIELWRQAERENRKPTAEQIAMAKAKVGYEKIKLDAADKTVEFVIEGMSVDLGGIAKGYGIDKAVEALKAGGAMSAMVDVGGDIRCFGKGTGENPEKGWRIGLQDPTSEGGLLMVLKLRDAAVATSGDYRRYVIIEGEKFSHIYNPSEGTSVTELMSVSVLAATAIEADILATSVSVMGVKRGLELVESIENAEAILIPAGDEIELLHTSRIGRYIDTSASTSAESMASRMITQKNKSNTQEK